MIPKNTLILTSQIEEVSKVYEWIEMNFKDKVENKLRNNILLITQEIVTNAIVHGNQEDTSKEVTVTFDMNEEEITITIKDEGEGCPPLPTKEEAQVLDYLSEDGRGLKLAVLMCKQIVIDKNLTTLVFEK